MTYLVVRRVFSECGEESRVQSFNSFQEASGSASCGGRCLYCGPESVFKARRKTLGFGSLPRLVDDFPPLSEQVAIDPETYPNVSSKE